jgi:hypothetical protein
VSDLHVRQIRAATDKTFRQIVDVSDLAERPEADRENAFLSRGLAALSLAHLANVSPEDAAAAITDGFGDNGLDAVYYHPGEKVLYLIQAKWHGEGNGSVDRGEIQKFIKGFRDLINARWDRFPEKLQKRKQSIESALNDARTKIVLVVAHTGQQGLSEEVKSDIKDALDEANSPTEIVSSQALRQGDIYSIISQGLGGAPIDLQVVLYDWGQVREPYQGFYGQVAASDVAGWLTTHQNRLFAPNLRVFLGVTQVNASMVETLTQSPENFWYFNNGVTALCRTVQKKPLGGNTRETGYFDCSDLRIVNGAQTVGAIADAASKDPSGVGRARVGIRLISLESCPAGFDKEVTKFNNSQNRIERRDFVALDPQQERIASELLLEGVTYLYKSGETLNAQDSGFDIVEATVARACFQSDVVFTVNAKAEIGTLWSDIEEAPYKILFNGSVTGPSIWRLVQIARAVESQLAQIRAASEGRKRLLSVHGNRFLIHVVMQCLKDDLVKKTGKLEATEVSTVQTAAKAAFDQVSSIINAKYPDAYLANLFKNVEKCKNVAGEFKCS